MNKENNKEVKPTFWNIFKFILLITFIGFGGGNAMVPVIKKYAVDKYKWLTNKEFDENVIISNILPGPSVIETISYVALKHLSFWKAMLVVMIGALPHCLLVFILFYFSTFIPLRYLYVIQVGVLVAIIATLLGFTWNYFKKGIKNLNVLLWWILFVVSFAFSLFVPTPFNMPIGLMVVVILTFVIVEYSLYKRNKNKQQKEANNG